MKKNMLFKVSTTLIILSLLLSGLYLYIVKNGFFIKNKLVSSIVESEYSHLKNVKNTLMNNINVYYNNLNEQELGEIKEEIEESKTDAEKYLKKMFGEDRDSLDIVLINDINDFNKEFNNKNEFTEKQGIYANGTIYIPIDFGIDKYILKHEYTHYRVDKFCIKNEINSFNIPSWFNEGISEYIAYKDIESFDMKNGKAISIKELDNIINSDDIRVERAYNKSHKIIDKIIELKGESIIKEIIVDSKYNDFYKSLEKNIGMKLEDFEKLLYQ